ncbi:hypothetical protein [Tenuibacillus multivorans]|uniref:Uncharacterized protein n=1 Tax=Tenuibacillus multivorans TaxID=237069 RepID=A0A1H0EJF7_9BACI|nr:hypothetical protein [Tenuibacillus multivorans]GEL77135.1 hypothetical protein TMU01_13700 [Tenuibacillus multivorans]SDN82419.1 hypothetical protein SAMN05216498_3175 [Tenuibacillus multivorans]
MGYILPVNFHQYAQYQHRHISKTTKHELALNPIFRAELKERLKQPKDLDQKYKESNQHIHSTTESKFIHNHSNQMANITGKGRYFSETI